MVHIVVANCLAFRRPCVCAHLRCEVRPWSFDADDRHGRSLRSEASAVSLIPQAQAGLHMVAQWDLFVHVGLIFPLVA